MRWYPGQQRGDPPTGQGGTSPEQMGSCLCRSISRRSPKREGYSGRWAWPVRLPPPPWATGRTCCVTDSPGGGLSRSLGRSTRARRGRGRGGAPAPPGAAPGGLPDRHAQGRETARVLLPHSRPLKSSAAITGQVPQERTPARGLRTPRPGPRPRGRAHVTCGPRPGPPAGTAALRHGRSAVRSPPARARPRAPAHRKQRGGATSGAAAGGPRSGRGFWRAGLPLGRRCPEQAPGPPCAPRGQSRAPTRAAGRAGRLGKPARPGTQPSAPGHRSAHPARPHGGSWPPAPALWVGPRETWVRIRPRRVVGRLGGQRRSAAGSSGPAPSRGLGAAPGARGCEGSSQQLVLDEPGGAGININMVLVNAPKY